MGGRFSATLDVGYPIYAAKFINNKTVLVAGGGGEGNNGIPNKITAVKCFYKATEKLKMLQKFRKSPCRKTKIRQCAWMLLKTAPMALKTDHSRSLLVVIS